MKQETLITIKGKRKADERRKGQVIPPRFRDELARRRGDPLIIFYDLGQVNHQDLNDPPVWVDHPILKTPEYTTRFVKFGAPDSGTLMAEYHYDLDPFTDSDFQSYTDMMFNYSVIEWNRRYRRVDNTSFFSTNYTFDMRISMWNTSLLNTHDNFILTNPLERAGLGAFYKTQKDLYLGGDRWAYELDREGAIYKGLNDLSINMNPLSDGRVAPGYFGFSTTDKDSFKVTATYDPGAADVGVVVPRGRIEVYLMPLISMWAATSNSEDWETTEVLGLCYQVNPRGLWPRYVAPADASGTGGAGDDTAVANYLAYQKARPGMQYSTWEFFGYDPESPTSDPIVVETPGVPADWTGQTKWGLASVGGVAVGGTWYGSGQRSGPFGDSFTNFNTGFTAIGDDPNFGNALFQNTTPFLVAVFKMGGQFYYVWDIQSGGNFSAFQLFDQGERFRLARNITWDPSRIENTLALDGTGAFYDL
jgi:hypothetical protein